MNTEIRLKSQYFVKYSFFRFNSILKQSQNRKQLEYESSVIDNISNGSSHPHQIGMAWGIGHPSYQQHSFCAFLRFQNFKIFLSALSALPKRSFLRFPGTHRQRLRLSIRSVLSDPLRSPLRQKHILAIDFFLRFL